MTRKHRAVAAPARRRNLFAEIAEGFDALVDARRGTRTLKTHVVKFKPAPSISPADLVKVRAELRISRPIFAACLRTNVRTLENWEQGRAKPNAQAALLISLVKRFPDTIERLAAI